LRKPLTLFCAVFSVSLTFFLPACKKSGGNKDNTRSTGGIHFDLTKSNNIYNRTIFFGSSKFDAQQMIRVGSTAAGLGEYATTGFDILNLKKSDGTATMNYYLSDSLANYISQISNCADQDNEGNIWVGGVAFTSDYAKPYVVKLDKGGNVLFATGFVKKEHPKEYNYKNYLVGSLKVLKNGDVLLLLVCPYDVQLIRMKTDGNVIWNKQYAIDDSKAYYLENGHNTTINENAQGDLFFLSLQPEINVGGVRLTRVTAAGNLVYSVGFMNIGTPLYMQLTFLSTGELLMFGQDDNTYRPVIVKIKPDDGSVINDFVINNDPTLNSRVYLNDIAEVNGEFKLALADDYDYDIFTLNSNFNITGSVKTLAQTNGAFYSGAMVYDAQSNVLNHLIDFNGANSGSFAQFLQTDINGLSCHGQYPKKPVNMTISPLDPGRRSGSAMIVTDNTPGAQPMKFTKTSITPHAIEACSQ
jgi:hypothetical protein